MFEYWFMFPLGVFIGTIAMSTGIGGASMFTPFFFTVLNLPASVAVGSGLLIEFFGFTAGLWGFVKKELIQYDIGTYLLFYTIPMAIVGSILSFFIPDIAVMTALVVLLLILAYVIYDPNNIIMQKHYTEHEKCHDDMDKCYTEPSGYSTVIASSLLGGLFAGLVSTGIGEINDFVLLEEYDMHGPITAGTSVFVVACTIFIGVITHAYGFVTNHLAVLPRVISIVTFAIPGVLLGAVLGVRVSEYIPEDHRNSFIGILFFILAITTTASMVSRGMIF